MSRASERALIVLFLHLEQMEKAGVPLVQSLAEARDTAVTPKLAAAIDGVLHEVKQGQSLHQAMAFYPKAFDETIVSLITVGEKSGKLARVLGQCLDYARRREEHARLMRKATRQPKISLAIILLLAVFRGSTALPWAVAIIIVSVVAFFTARRLSHTVRYLTDALFLSLPVLGTFVARDSWARFAASLAMLFEAGVDMRSGLATAAEAMPNLVLRRSAEEALPRVVRGASLQAAFREGKCMDKMALAMLKAGEDTGNFAHTLRELADYYEKSTADALTALQQYTGPILTIITGSILYLGF